MNINLLNKLLAIDDSFKHKLTIVTPHKFSYRNFNYNYKKNKELLDRYAKKYLIQELSKITRKTLELKEYKLLNKNDLVQMKENFLAIVSFEVITPKSKLYEEWYEKDRYIHFHYVFSKIIATNNEQNEKLINKLEKEVLTAYTAKLERLKKVGKIKKYELKPYIPYQEYVKEHPDKASFISYILKESDRAIYPYPFFSQALDPFIK